MIKEKEGLITRDYLAVERTRLANERTFLSYFRTFVVFLSSGIAILHFEFLSDLIWLGIFLLIIAPIILGIGLGRLIYVRKSIRKFYRKGLRERNAEND
jgi:putative membrane protein